MRAAIASAAVLLVAVLGCDRMAATESNGCAKDTDCKGDRVCQAGQCVAPSGAASVPTATTATNDGTDPRHPVLAPDDANFTDTRRGWGWSDRAWQEVHAGKYGWAVAACQKALALPDLDQKAKGALLYNDGLAYEGGHDKLDAKGLFQESLAARPANDPGRAEVQAALARVGGPLAPSRPAVQHDECSRPARGCPAGKQCCHLFANACPGGICEGELLTCQEPGACAD
jgi:hypothetical protein